ncbi:atp-dependent dna helicase 2 subunit 1 [Trichoderma arundinaceum]|uniref:Atp-dependent dna helicase 2 subunit 1 n=1 Tax=Trichoderma arundinaceum TaxID=490622 RepID=A0A395NTP5_TRIAR|nr:atp-dependent dna helicase 2 subunit 1 [Trichoderma arundinaceum]
MALSSRPPLDWCTTPALCFFQDRNPTSRPIQPWAQAKSLSSPTKSCLPSSSPQQAPDSAYSPQSLVCCAQSPPKPSGRPSMAEFLASFNFRDEAPSVLDGQPCASVEELQSQLRDAFEGKVTATRAERIATRLDLAASAELTLGVSEGENDVLEGLSTLDPSLGGALSTSISTAPDGGQATRVVLVSDSLMNQPQDEPALQRSIASHIVAGIGQVDDSEWMVRDVSRGTHGWSFSFLCKGSMQHWQRQNKSQAKTLVADYSQRELDPLLANYDHIPLHRTVADLAILFKPPSPRHPLPPTEKQPKTPRQPGSSKKKRDTDKTLNGEGSKPRKRKRKTDDVAVSGEQATVDSNGASQLGELQSLASQHPQPGVADDQPQAGEESSSSTGQQQDAQADQEADQVAAQNSAAGLLIINVSPEEAERRRNVAVVMLRDAGVDPDSLSPEQFNIFANQSPDLQKESLNMLVKYGAERLRIVHPGNKEGSAQPSASPSPSTPAPQSNIQGSSSGPVTTNELVLQTPGSANKKKSRRKSQAVNDGAEEVGADPNTPRSTKKPRRRGTGKSRVACFQYKAVDANEAYSVREKRQSVKSSALITAEDEQDDNDQDAPGTEMHDEPPPPEHEHLHEDAEGYPEMHDDSVNPQMPIGDVMANNMGVTDWEASHNPPNYFSSASIGVCEAGASQLSHPSSAPLSDLVLPHGRSYYSNISAAEMQDQALTQPITHEHRKSPSKAPAHGSGRHVATRTIQEEDHHNSVNSTAASEWSSGGNPVTQAAAVVAAVVTSLQDQNSRESVYGLPDSPGARSSAWRPVGMDASQQPSMGAPHQQGVAAASLQHAAAASSLNDIPRANSRTGKYSGRGTVHDALAADAYHSPTLSDQQPSNAPTSGLQAPAGMAGSAAYNSYDRYSSTRGAEAPSTDRITYEPYSYQRDAASATQYTSYGHGSHATTTAASMPAQTATAMSSADRSVTQTSGSQTYGTYSNSAPRNASHVNSASYVGSRANTQAQDFNNSSSDSSRNSRQAFNMRSQTSTPRPGQGAVKQERNYSVYPSHTQQQQQRVPQQQQQQQHTQQTNQHQAWYGFNNQSNNSFATTGGHGSNYSWNMPGDS